MKRYILQVCMAAAAVLTIVGCIKDPYDEAAAEAARQAEISSNAASVFGVTFSTDQSWSSTTKSNVTITANAPIDGIVKVQVLTCSPFSSDGDASDASGAVNVSILNEASVKAGDMVTLTYDAPSWSSRLFAACITEDGAYYIRGFELGQESVSFVSSNAAKAQTRAIDPTVLERFSNLPANPTLAIAEESYARQRGYPGFENDLLYRLSDADEVAQMVSLSDFDYDSDTKADMTDFIFTCLPNKASNIEKIRETPYYNANSYPLTTGADPIIIEPIYKNDGGWHEVEYCHIYYYYFKDSDIVGLSDAEQVLFFQNLPKYRAVNVNRSVNTGGVSIGMPDNVLRKNTAYALIYWGEGTPVLGETTGSYTFPEGYRIGFMIRNCDKNVNHHGEMYCDGRLNTEVNKYGHLASSKLGDTDARMAWLSFNGRFFLCCESGTDRDFNDLILEIEGGVNPLIVIPGLDTQVYTLCFEDRDLGDYDMNDVVIKAQRIDRTHVKYSIEACGANDEIYLRNLNGNILNETTEIHTLFGVGTSSFVNISDDSEKLTPIQEVFTVDPSFSFTDAATQVYLYNKTQDREIHIAQKGEDPHAIIIPSDFKFPIEKVCIKDAYEGFNSWGQNTITDTDWYLFPVEGKVYTHSVFR